MSFVVLAALFACSTEGDDSGPAPGCADAEAGEADAVWELEGDPGCGAVVFAEHCAECHGDEGRGGTGPDLAEHMPYHTDQELTFVILGGHGEMPPQPLGNQQVADVLAHLRQSFGEFEGEGH